MSSRSWLKRLSVRPAFVDVRKDVALETIWLVINHFFFHLPQYHQLLMFTFYIFIFGVVTSTYNIHNYTPWSRVVLSKSVLRHRVVRMGLKRQN